jgi:hypothetical protein
MPMIPLQQWICDECGEVIAKPEDGWLEWFESVHYHIAPHGFRIVHHYNASPIGGCYYTDRRRHSDILLSNNHLDDFLGQEGLDYLLGFMASPWRRPANPAAFIDIIRRLHIAGYEEARLAPDQAAAQTDTYAAPASGGGMRSRKT